MPKQVENFNGSSPHVTPPAFNTLIKPGSKRELDVSA